MRTSEAVWGLAAAYALLLVGACTPTIFKDDIASFNKGVEDASAAFTGLHDKSLAQSKGLALKTLAASGTPLMVSPECGSVAETGALVWDTVCLAEWATYRATPVAARGDPPSCPRSSEQVRDGELAFYDLAVLGEQEEKACALGVPGSDGAVDPKPLEEAEVLLVEAPKLLPALKNYSASLVAIAGADDRDALQTSVGDARDAANKLGERLDGLDGKTSPYTAVIGPVSDLLGTVLIAGLEHRRYQALVNVTSEADPVITRTAMTLSQVAMPLAYPEFVDASEAYQRLLPDPSNPPKGDAWIEAYNQAHDAGARYLALYDASPTPVFKAMAEAHHALVAALADPDRQAGALATAVNDFVDKANAANEAFAKAREEAKAQKEAAKAADNGS